MAALRKPLRLVRFGPFEYNPATGELRRRGYKVKLQGQPLQLLNMMIERAGEVVTREEMQARLWPENTFVDFEHSLNTAIKKLRRALGDFAAKPRFIETVARQGYRFVASIETVEDAGTTPVSQPPSAVAVPAAPAKRRNSWPLSLIALLLIAGAVFVGLTLRSRPGPPRRSKLKLLLAGEGDLTNPVISPDGKMLAYVKAEGQTRRIYVQRLAGGSPIRLFHEDGRETEPAFGPEGERIAFTYYPPRSNDPQICVAPVLGGEVARVVEGGRDPAWSPDGSRLAFILEQPDGDQALATSRSDGTGLRIILAADGTYPFLHAPSWSSDGRSIAVDRSMGGVSSEIWLIPAQGGAASKLESPRPGVSMYHPVFTPDGRGLICSSNRAGAINLWYHPFKKGARTVQLTRSAGPEEWPSISRAGRVVFLKIESRDVLFVTRLEAGAPSRLLSHSPFLWSPSISPDGRELAFSQSEYDGLWRIWTMPLVRGDPRPLTSGLEPQIYSRFSRDDQWLIYFTWSPGRSRIWRVPRHGGPAQPLTPADEDAAYGDLSPDGHTLAFARTDKRLTAIYVVPAAGGVERQLIHASSTVPRWSPDGKWITFSADRSLRGGVFITRSDGSATRRITHSGGWPVWLPDGKRIAFRTLRADGTQQINIVTLKDGKVTSLTNIKFAGDNDPFDFSPDGKRITYTDRETFSSEIWLLDARREGLLSQ